MTTPYAIRYEINWGTRQSRAHQFIYVSRKPTREEVIRLLRERLGVDAPSDWFLPRYSGLIEVYPLKIEELG